MLLPTFVSPQGQNDIMDPLPRNVQPRSVFRGSRMLLLGPLLGVKEEAPLSVALKQLGACLIPSQDLSPTSVSVPPTCPPQHTTHLLHRELMRPHGNAVHELHGTPQPVELHALIHVHDPVARERPTPDGVIQKGPDPCQDDLEHRQATAEALLGQQVPLPCDCNLLQKAQPGMALFMTVPRVLP